MNKNIFVRGDSSDNSNAWDDTELIKAYERAMSQAESAEANTYSVGDHCRAVYSEDDIEYEAIVIDKLRDNQVMVRFIGYNNTQVVPVDELLPSQGPAACRQQELQSQATADGETDKKHDPLPLRRPPHPSGTGNLRMNFPPPPPFPPNFAKAMSDEEHESLNSMLMAWYMSGFYTGYYQGIKKGNRKH